MCYFYITCVNFILQVLFLYYRCYFYIRGVIFYIIGVNLAFITYPESMSKQHPAFISVFYLMLLLMCLARVLPCLLTLMTAILDRFPKLYVKGRHVTLVALTVCAFVGICSISLTTQVCFTVHFFVILNG